MYLHCFLRIVAFGDGYIVLMFSLIEGESRLVLLLDSLVERVTSVVYSLQVQDEYSMSARANRRVARPP